MEYRILVVAWLTTTLGVALASGAEQGAHRERYYDGKTLAEWVRQLKGKAPNLPVDPRLAATVRRDAAGMLGRIAHKGKQGTRPAIAALTDALTDEDPMVRAAATAGLAEAPPAFRRHVVPLLCRSLQDGDPGVREMAVRALAGVGADAKTAVPALARALHDPDRMIRTYTIGVLLSLGPNAKEAIPALMDALEDSDGMLRFTAAQAIKGMGPKAQAAVPALMRTLKRPDAAVAAMAMEALGAIGPCAGEALPLLRKASASDDSNGYLVRVLAAKTIWKITGNAKEVLPELKVILWRSRHPQARREAAHLLEEIGAAVKPAVPYLIDALDDIDDDVGKAAAAALKKIDPKAAAKAGVK
jgi:HEAT repeat protein